jgi:diguanylate cyclase (GGDEF)-like protein
MPKRRPARQQRDTAATPADPAPRRAAPHEATEPHRPAPPPGGARSDPMRLAVEVFRLEAELAEMRVRMRELEARANVDPLTEVANRRGFARDLARAIAHVERYGGSVALVAIDLDDFKPVNDRHGHAVGDAVLQAVAATLTTNARASDSVARLGGDEFAVLLWNLAERDARTKAMHFEAAIATACAQLAASSAVGASAGVAMLERGETADAFAARADAAMYARKAERKRAR